MVAKRRRSPRLSSGARTGFGWVRDLPDHRDLQYANHRMAMEAPLGLSPHVDLTPDFQGVEPYNQGDLKACAPNAIAAAFQFDQLKQQQPSWIPSRLFIYYNARVLNGTVPSDSGVQMRECMKVLISLGVPDETLWPYDQSVFATEPSQSAFEEAKENEVTSYFRLDNSDIGQLKTCLDAGFPFAFGIMLYSSYLSTGADGVIPMPGFGETPMGGHALLAVGFDDGNGTFKVRNSFGVGWGNQGYGYVPYQYVVNANLCSDFWTIRAVSGGAPPLSGT
jgi:C1A family cysteine protease